MGKLENKELHDALYYGVSSVFDRWTALQLAINGMWGGHDTPLKLEWFKETIADYLYDNGNNIESFDIESVLEQVLLDEFSIEIDDDSHVQVSEMLYRLCKELVSGKLDLYSNLIQLAEDRSKTKAVVDASITKQESSDASEDEASGFTDDLSN